MYSIIRYWRSKDAIFTPYPYHWVEAVQTDFWETPKSSPHILVMGDHLAQEIQKRDLELKKLLSKNILTKLKINYWSEKNSGIQSIFFINFRLRSIE